MRFAHVMIRVNNLDESISFYQDILGFKLLRKSENVDYKYTLAFLGYGDDVSEVTCIELTYNWDQSSYDHGTAFGHLCVEVEDVYKSCEKIREQGGVVTREAGPVKGGTSIIAFIKDPNGYQIELINRKK